MKNPELEKRLTKIKTDLAIAKVTARKHVQAAAKSMAAIETFGPEFSDDPYEGALDGTTVARTVNGATLADLKERAADSKTFALQWQTKADQLVDAMNELKELMLFG